ncbi:hypothetical protein [Natronogracilivirga saccharolytica]|uniref:DoxX family membrane protein n=1 Tax=Natronogracilivirga saccharolytica TaxID=2812953 RepID=A0A8J7RHA4_9BACT|nr:hypothetical protein [Natronogracilivirga saccharolytica]MBP3191830.1 hypothetical protein [Natronogracilivirga saccharolytica]
MPIFSRLLNQYDHIDQSVTRWMARNGIFLLRISIGLIFVWFGALKFFPGASPAEQLAGSSIEILTFGIIPAAIGLPLLAVWECLIGIGMFVRKYMRFTILMLYVQMIGTFSPIVILPYVVFDGFPLVLTMDGQYIIKNVVVIAAALVIGATVRGGKLESEPES